MFQKGPDPKRNAAAIFKPGHPHRWKPGQSGNKVGKPASLVAFEEQFAAALANEGSPEILSKLIWDAAKRGESWAVLKLAERFEWQKTQATDDRELTVKVVYVERTDTDFAEDALGTVESDPGVEPVQLRLLRAPMGQDGLGDGPADSPSAEGPADGVVRTELPPVE